MSTDPGSAPHQGPPLEPRPPAIANLATWWLVAAGVVGGIGRAVFLVVSPLWFMGVYLMLIALLPVFLWLHERWDTVVLVFLAAIAGAVDILRFRDALQISTSECLVPSTSFASATATNGWASST